ncbi:MFS transporter [Actinoplanes sp. NPDC051346]|uniref:MFS transporter n=1 Tax=Actinoplanes sp. NPDC051346 TaxID=3155048 RepID=UPI003441F353
MLPASGPRPAVAGTVVALGAVSFCTDVSSEMVAAVLPLYLVVGLGLSPVQVGLLDGAQNGATALLRLAGGHLADRWRRRKLVAGIGYAMSAAAKAALVAADTAATSIGAALLLDRLGKGLRTAPRDALISLSSHPGTQGRAFGVHRAMDTAGALLGPLAALAVLAAAPGHYPAVFVASTAFAVLGLVVLAVFVTEHPAPARRAAAPVRAGIALLRRPGVPTLCVRVSLLGAVTIGDSFVYLILQRRLDFPLAWFPLLPLGVAAGYLMLAAPIGRLADRVGRWRTFLGGHTALLATYLTLAVPSAAGPLVVGVIALMGFYYAATDGVLMAAAAPLFPAELRTTGLALVQTVHALTRAVGAVAFGAAWTAWGLSAALTVAAGGAVVALLAGVIGHGRDRFPRQVTGGVR